MRLLILGCSATKRHDPSPMQAIDRYDGPAFRVLRKALSSETKTGVLIVSAKYGVLFPYEEIMDYDQRLTAAQARWLAPDVSLALRNWMRQYPDCGDVFVNLGQAYLPAVSDFIDWCGRYGIVCTLATGGIGQRLAQMKAWLEADYA